MKGSMDNATYDLHGIVGVALHGAREEDAAIVDRQLGPIRGPLPAAPRIEIVFSDRLPVGAMSLLGVRQVGFDEDRFYVLRSSHKVPSRVAIDLGGLAAGGGTTIHVERGAPAIPLLVPILNLIALGAGALPLHAAAIRYRGVGLLITGWSKGGKTETLLAFMRHGAEYIGDEWVYLTDDGRMHGIPEPIRIWEWHLNQLSNLRARIPLGQRGRLRAVSLVRRGMRAVPLRPARRFGSFLSGQLHVDVPPDRLFESVAQRSAALDAICFVGSTEAAQVTLAPIEPGEISARMVHSLAYERSELLATYLQHRYAFPDRRSALVEGASALEGERLAARLAGRRAFSLEHPYPVEIDALFRTLAPALAEA